MENMENKDFQKIIRSAKTFSLSSEEKKLMMSRVSLIMQETPYLAPAIKTPYYHKALLIFERNKYASVFLTLAFISVLSGAGTSLAAQKALPEDILYPVKVHVTEKLKSAFTFGASANAKLETEQANTRLSEAEEITKKREFTDKDKKWLGESFQKHSKEVKKLSGELKAQGKLEAAAKVDADFDDVLKNHQKTLLNIGITNESDIEIDIENSFKEKTENEKPKEVEKEGEINTEEKTKIESESSNEKSPSENILDSSINTNANFYINTDINYFKKINSLGL